MFNSCCIVMCFVLYALSSIAYYVWNLWCYLFCMNDISCRKIFWCVAITCWHWQEKWEKYVNMSHQFPFLQSPTKQTFALFTTFYIKCYLIPFALYSCCSHVIVPKDLYISYLTVFTVNNEFLTFHWCDTSHVHQSI